LSQGGNKLCTMDLPRRKFLHVNGAAALALVFGSTYAQGWPNHSVQLFVGYAPDNGLDSVAQVLADRGEIARIVEHVVDQLERRAEVHAVLGERRLLRRARSAEDRAVESAEGGERSGPSTALVLADRAVVIRRQLDEAYPVTRKTRITYSGRGYGAGYAQGQRADIGNARLGQTRAISRA